MMLLFLAALADASQPVVVSSLTTAQLVEQCRGKDDDPAASFCTGYVLGVFDVLSQTHQVCPSAARVSNVAVLTAARKYLRKRARKTTAAPSFVVRTALQSAFPCKHE